MKKISLLLLLVGFVASNLMAQPEEFNGEVDRRESIKLLMANLHINDKPAKNDIWVCAFDTDGNVVSKEPTLTKNGTGEFNLVLFQDDGDDKDNAHGVKVGEKVVIKFYYEDEIHTVKTKSTPWKEQELMVVPKGSIFYAKVKTKK